MGWSSKALSWEAVVMTSLERGRTEKEPETPKEENKWETEAHPHTSIYWKNLTKSKSQHPLESFTDRKIQALGR